MKLIAIALHVRVCVGHVMYRINHEYTAVVQAEKTQTPLGDGSILCFEDRSILGQVHSDDLWQLLLVVIRANHLHPLSTGVRDVWPSDTAVLRDAVAPQSATHEGVRGGDARLFAATVRQTRDYTARAHFLLIACSL